MKELPKDDEKKQEMLSEIAEKFKTGKEYTEDEVNEAIKKEFEDFPLVRRELVNFGYFEKDSYKGTYKLKKTKLNKEEIQKIKQHQQKMIKNKVYK